MLASDAWGSLLGSPSALKNRRIGRPETAAAMVDIASHRHRDRTSELHLRMQHEVLFALGDARISRPR